MKKIIIPVLVSLSALFTVSCNQDLLKIDQKGVTAYETFYDGSDASAESALTAAYARFSTYVTGRGNEFIYTPIKGALNMGGDDIFGAGSNYGDNDFLPQLNEFRYDSGNQVIGNFYQGLFLANYNCNLVIDNFKDSNSAVANRCVAEARTLRAYIYFLLTALWDTPPFIDHVITDGLPYNCDKDPENPMSHNDLLQWIADECIDAANALDERKSTADKDGAVKVTKGFAYALAGKALLFKGDYANAKVQLAKVIESGKYALVSGDKYWQNFHAEGDGNEEKIFESNLEYNNGIGAWGGINQRSTWMESQIWSWRSDHFVDGANPSAVYTGGVDGWGGSGVPQWFGDEFFANDGHSYRFDATLKHIDDVVYNMTYLDASINSMSLDEKKASKKIGISDVKDGLYGQSFWLGYKQIMRASDAQGYDANVRLNNNIVMRYAEVLLMYAECCLQTGDAGTAAKYIRMIQERAGIKPENLCNNATMDVLKKEKSYELWFEGCRFLDIVRWGDTQKIANAGQDVPKLFDKLHRAPAEGENPVWENGTEANSRFYTVSSHEAIDTGAKVGFKAGKHDHFPFPKDVMDKNPNIVQNPGWE